MARQTNRKTTQRKTTRRKKSKTGSNGLYLGIGLIAVLLALITFSVVSITGENEIASKEEEQKITYIPAKKPEKKEETAKNIAVPKKEEKKQEVVKQVEKKKEEPKQEVAQDENITDLIKLVLYDHEISRSSVKERVKKNSAGKEVTYFDIVCDENMQKNISSAISSILRQKGYKVSATASKVTASNSVDEYNIILKAPVKEVVKKEEPKKENKQVQANKNNNKEKEIVQVVENKTKYPPLPAKSKKEVNFAILLDDGGNSVELAREFAALSYPVAIAILPHLEHTRVTAQISKKAGKTVFLHFPMAPKSYPNTDPGKGAIVPTMPDILIAGVVKENFESLGVKADGFNNHMGSAITEDARKMSQVLEHSKNYTSRFVDSRTTPNTIAYAECKKAGLKCGENKIFIDNDNSVEAILAKLYEAAEKAKNEGSLIAIGHIRPNTLQALRIALPQLEERNYKIVNITKLIK